MEFYIQEMHNMIKQLSHMQVVESTGSSLIILRRSSLQPRRGKQQSLRRRPRLRPRGTR
jgi:hypothetical protein